MTRQFAEVLVAGTVLASVYALTAVGFVVLFRATKVMSFTQGSFMLFGALGFWELTGREHLPIVLAGVIVAVLVSLLGALTYVLVFDRVATAHHFITSVATIGLAGLFQMITDVTWGTKPRLLPPVVPKWTFILGDFRISSEGIAIVLVATAAVVALAAFVRYTNVGQRMEAVADNPGLAAHVGISTVRVSSLAWALAAGTAAIAGMAFVTYTTMDPTIVPGLGLLVFPAVIIGGTESVVGALAGSLVVGIVQSGAATILGGQWQDVAAYSVLFIVLMTRPQGLFGHPEVIRV